MARLIYYFFIIMKYISFNAFLQYKLLPILLMPLASIVDCFFVPWMARKHEYSGREKVAPNVFQYNTFANGRVLESIGKCG